MNIEKKYALISVFDKTNLSYICQTLAKFNIGLISTGSTAEVIKKAGFKCKLVSDLTKFNEILDGRVKTLHPKIHASILHDRKNKYHINSFKKLNFPIIDFVIVNLYPFEKIIQITNNVSKCINMIDVGGPSLLRSAAKNYKSITTINNITDYGIFIKNISSNNGKTTLSFRRQMAQKIFQTTAAYDSSIASWFANKKQSVLKISNLNSTRLRYGENPNQKSKYYFKSKINLIEKAKLKGSELSYNNILDLDAGLNCMTEFIEPTCVIIKHNNPCGIASAPTIHKAAIKAIEADPVSAFGGMVILNRMLNKKTAEVLNNKFFQLIAAEKFNVNAVQMLRNKKNLILINKTKLLLNKKDDIKSVMNGYLVQEKNIIKIKKNNLKCVSNIKINSKKIDDLLFALKVCKHVKSNAIVLVNNKQTIGIGAGQMSRLDSTKLALDKAGKLRRRAGYVAASDAFFPFLDNLKLLINKNCKAIAKPLGSINDAKIIKFAESKKFPLYSFKYRLFKH